MKKLIRLAAALCGGISSVVYAANVTAKPNILIFYADDLGYGELTCYGNKDFRTPNIDTIATNGIRFTQGYVSAPLCSPSRAGLMTGRYQTRFGHENNSMAPGGHLPFSETTLANRLKSLGYATGIIGKWHLGAQPDALPTQRGFDYYYGVTGNPNSYFEPKGFIDSDLSTEVRPVTEKDFYTTDYFGAKAVEWIGKHKAEPWFLYFPFNAVHAPHEAPQKYLDRFANLKDKDHQTMAAMLSGMDDAVGRVLTQLRELGLEQNTLVFFIADNGAPDGEPPGEAPRSGNGPLRGFKHTTWEGGFRVPFMVQWPGKLSAGVVSDIPVIQLDVMPTCVTAAGGQVDPAWNLDGVDMVPFLTGKTAGRPHENLFWRIDGMWAVRHGDWKLVHGKAGTTPPELFNLADDPGEKKNLASVLPERVSELQTLWDNWNAQLADPAEKKNKPLKKAQKKK